MTVESINKNNTNNNLISGEGKILSFPDKTELNKTKDVVSIMGNNATYDAQLKSFNSEINDLKQLVGTLVAQELLAKRGGSLLKQTDGNNKETPVVNSNSGRGNPMMNAMMQVSPLSGSSIFKGDTTNPQDPSDPKPKTEEELIREAMQQQILAQMKIKRDLLAWDTTLMKEKFEYELTLAWQQHETKISEMMMAAFSKIREMNEQMWMNLKQKEDQLDQQRIKVLGGF